MQRSIATVSLSGTLPGGEHSLEGSADGRLSSRGARDANAGG